MTAQESREEVPWEGRGAEEALPLPWSRSCFVCGEDNPHGLRARSYKVGESVELPFVAREEFAGWRRLIHGGLIATVVDEVMTWASILGAGAPCVAAEFSVRLVEPLPPGTHCTAVARLVRRRRRVLDAEALLRDGAGRVFARAHGRYMALAGEAPHHFRDDFVDGSGCLPLDRIFRAS